MQRNVEHNNVTSNVHVAELDWGTEIDPVLGADIDVILAADCVYFEVGAPSVVGFSHPSFREPFPSARGIGLPSANADAQPAFPLLVQTLCDLAPAGKGLEILFCWKKRRKVSRQAPPSSANSRLADARVLTPRPTGDSSKC